MTQKDESMDENNKYKDGVNHNARLIVRNISFKATEEDLKKHFSEYGTVEEVKLLKKPDGRLVGCGFVHYTQVPMANKALTATNKKPFLGRPITVAWAVQKDKYSEKLKAGKAHSSGVLENPIIADKEESTKQTAKEEKKDRVNRNARLIIRNVSFKATEESLKEHFEPYGEILEVKLLKKPDGKLVGCAFVHFKNVPMAKKALLNTNMNPFLSRPISVDWAVAKNKYMQHVVEQQLQLQDDVKEEPESGDEEPLEISAELKAEVKSESESDDEAVKTEDESGDSDDESDAGGGSDDDDDDEEKDEDDDEDEDEDEEDVDDNASVADSTFTEGERKRIKLNDAEDGCTVFATNIPFAVDDEQLRSFAANVGDVKYALVCVDKLTEHSKGSGFIKFVNKEDADAFLALPRDQLKLEGQVLQVKPALKRESLQANNEKKQPKDNRSLYLVKEGVVVAGTKAAVGVSASDMAKRLALERSKTQMLKNLNRFVSRYRLVVSNLPPHFDDGRLRALCAGAGSARAAVTECRVMRDLRAEPLPNGKHPSKGYGFVMFMKHEDALACLRKLNNNPEVFDKNNRPIVSFSIEDRTALNARKKRLEKSIANNPLANKEEQPDQQNRKRKNKSQQPDESNPKRGKFDTRNQDGGDRFGNNNKFDRRNENGAEKFGKQNKFDRKNQHGNEKFGNQNNGKFDRQNGGQFDRRNQTGGKFDRRNQNGDFKKPFNKFNQGNEEEHEYSGLSAREGGQHHMRSNQKLRMQADVHRQNVKQEKKLSQRSQKLRQATRERVKQPKQKVNKQQKGQNNTERKVNAAVKEASKFTDLVSKYKSKLAGNTLDKVKAKWYES